MVRIFRSGEPAPEWCALSWFRIVDLDAGQAETVARKAERVRILNTAGTVRVRFARTSQVLKENQFLDMPAATANCVLEGHSSPAQAVVLSGAWSDELGGCGIFRVANQDNPSDKGDPVAYPKATAVDSHYHDCDEYWILLEGRAGIVVGGQPAEMQPGDCLPIGMGYHHDMPQAPDPVKAVFFETSLEGRQRVGHLWEHTHGPAKPLEERHP